MDAIVFLEKKIQNGKQRKVANAEYNNDAFSERSGREHLPKIDYSAFNKHPSFLPFCRENYNSR